MTGITAAALAAATALTLAFQPSSPAAAEPSLPDLLVAATTAEGATRHLAALQRIADGADGNRAAGTPGHERSARYVGALLADAGYDVTYQRFAFPYREPVTERLTQLTPGERDIPLRLLSYTANTPAGGVQAPLADAGDGCEPEDFGAGFPADARIALIERGGCTFARKVANAADAGALGAVVHNNAPGALSGTLGEPAAGLIPAGTVSQEDGLALAAELAAGEEVTLRLEIEELAEERETVNVVAESPVGDPDSVVMAGAHLDSVLAGPGLNDNGSGSAGLLETALRLAEVDPAGELTEHRTRFAFWSAEELGLLGSEHYVAALPEAERERIALYLNFDMIASPNHGLFVYDADAERDDPVSAAIADDLTAFLGDRGLPARPTPFDGRSDYGPFLDAGIPAGGTFTGAEGLKSAAETELWGGTADAPYDPCYHASCDDLDNIGRTALDANVKAIAHSVGRYATRLPDTSP
ncbi:M28 family peptidase [Streptomyces millisiae]|uniref:M28 family peptidase n=1 Tax=Streptomyces millisiae TaxID=3075542 RepID=A0ABU2LKD9_9ACTN|nr:M28 family peptidase [Streptomyces sp. DSM 44918]MDT0318060.1 M28 family peptidase [Streptomyces sp. DSM 44918]